MRTELSQEALFNLYYQAIALSDTVLQIWLTVTFAAIIALYIASENITRFLRVLIVGLYTVSAVILIGRWLTAVRHMDHYKEILAASGFSAFPGQELVLLVGPLLMALLLLGTLVTIIFLVTYSRQGNA